MNNQINDNNPNIENTNITTEMRECYIDYAMSVIIGRALPDVRDGMKPVHRRILYAMHELGLDPDRQFRKCVRIVGDVLGKFHPHGDASVYDALTKMAQDFSTRYPTVKGHGNFGSIDGDSPAAMRYTEAKMDYISKEMLRDINKDTVDFIDNFDGSETEPEVLTARFPHLLVNGTSGIAVGMATNMPPHNLGEVIDATVAYIDNSEIEVEELLEKLPGPDFPTGGIIFGKDGIIEAYKTGHGKIKVRGKAKIVPGKRGKSEIIITEIPFQVNKSKLIEKIAQLHNNKKIEGITEVRDESDLKQGIKIVIDLKKDINPNIVLNRLYKYTDLETTFGITNLALVPDRNGKLHPKVLSLPQILAEYTDHQRKVITRRTEFDLNKAEKRAEILEGLLIALDNIDEVIDIIRRSRSTETARNKLQKRFSLSEAQARAILDMRLQRLVGLERTRIKNEYKELKEQIRRFKKILSDPKEIDKVIKDELNEIKDNYSDERRTEIHEFQEETPEVEYIPEKDLNVTLTHKGYLNSNVGAKSRKINIGDDDIIEYDFPMTNLDDVLIFTDKGKAYKISGTDLPEVKGKGKHIKSIVSMGDDENIINVLPVKDFNDKKEIFLASSNGLVKKTNLKEFDSQLKSGITAINLKTKDDKLVQAILIDENDHEIILASRDGLGIKFNIDELKTLGRNAAGVKGISLSDGDKVVGAVTNNNYLIVLTEDGMIKSFSSEELRPQNRAGKGLKIVSDSKQKVKDLKSSHSILTEYIYETDDGFKEGKIVRKNARTDKGKLLDKNVKYLKIKS